MTLYEKLSIQDIYYTLTSEKCYTYLERMYSLDMRKLASHVYQLFFSLRKTAIILNVSHTTISRWLKNPERKSYHRTPSLSTDHVIYTIKTSLLTNPFISIRKLVKQINDVCNVIVSRELVRTAISKLGFSKKKARFFSSPNGLEEKVLAFKIRRKAFIDEGRQFFSLDETSFGRNGSDIRGYAPRGQLLALKRSQPSRVTVSSLVIVSNTGIVKHQEVVGSFNTTLFCQFLESLELPSGSIILLDNVRFHHSILAKEVAIRKGWELLFTPPYSPWFNPIEGIFSIVKREYCKYGDILKSFQSVTHDHCKAFFNKSQTT